MIKGFNILRNIGMFDSVSPNASINLTRLSLIYGETGSGKTTIATILRSLSLGDSLLVNERKRVGSQHLPHLVVNNDGQEITFQNGAWSQRLPEIAIFDDAFVAANICSGIDLYPEQRQNLHGLILGKQGITLNSQLQALVAKINEHNTSLQKKGAAIPATAREPFNVEDFCKLESDPNIETKIEDAGRRLAAAKKADAIRLHSGFTPFKLPDFNIETIKDVLGQKLEDLQLDAENQVRTHLKALAASGEAWVAEGTTHAMEIYHNTGNKVCPFCAQELCGSGLIMHYQAYFSGAYKELKAKILQTKDGVGNTHGGDIPAAFERSISTAFRTHEFWSNFTELPKISVDTAAVSRDWKAAREAALQALGEKAASPLEATELSPDAVGAIQTYRRRIEEIDELSKKLRVCESAINVVKEQSAVDDLSALQNDLAKLNARKARFDPEILILCSDFTEETKAKKTTEEKRDATRAELDTYRQKIFPTYETAINDFLSGFNASFRLGKMKPVNSNAGSSASYCVVINRQNVKITAGSGEPSFRNTLSSGDRNTLALAFFFTSLDQSPNLAQKIVVIDDPMTSLDEHRTSKTRTEMIDLCPKVKQMIVLSHSKPFLCALWKAAKLMPKDRSAFRLNRTDSGSDIVKWDVDNDSLTEHDKRYKLILNYVEFGGSNIERKVAEALRPTIEAFLRFAYPSYFPPEQSIGSFLKMCNETSRKIMSFDDIKKLRDLREYANRFHHASNPAWETETINETELTDFAEKTIQFLSRGFQILWRERADNQGNTEVTVTSG